MWYRFSHPINYTMLPMSVLDTVRQMLKCNAVPDKSMFEKLLLILSSFQQPLCHLVLLNDVDMCAPTRQSVPIHSAEEGLRYRLEEFFRTLLPFISK